MSGSNRCFLAYIQVSQEAGKEVWDFHLFKNFPQFVVIHTVKGFSVVHEADVFLEFPCFFFRKSEQVIPAVTHLSIQQMCVDYLLCASQPWRGWRCWQEGSPHSSERGAGRSGSDREDLPNDTEAQRKDWTEGKIFRIEGRPVKGPRCRLAGVRAGLNSERKAQRQPGFMIRVIEKYQGP